MPNPPKPPRTPRKATYTPKGKSKRPRADLVTLADVAIPSRPRRKSEGDFAELRAQAMLIYLGAVQPTTVAEIHALPEFNVLHINTLEQWCTRDRWMERRNIFQRGLLQQVQARLADRIAARTMETIELLDPIKDQFANALKTANLAGTQPTQLAMTLCKVLDTQAKLVDQVVGWEATRVQAEAAKAAAHGTKEAGTPDANAAPRFTPEEAHALARAILRDRREKIEAELAATSINVTPEASTVEADDGPDGPNGKT